MKTVNHNRRNLALVLVAALFFATTLTAGGVLGQTGPRQCPNPRTISLAQSAGPATPLLSDFPTGSCSAGFAPNFGWPSGWPTVKTADRCFRHTFSFPPPTELCCQCVEGKGNTLTLQLGVLFGGQPGTPTSGNDTFGIYSGGTLVPGTGQSLYTTPVTTGQVVTKVIHLNCSWLANNRLSFLIQDDTAVLSAKLNVNTCCVKK